VSEGDRHGSSAGGIPRALGSDGGSDPAFVAERPRQESNLRFRLRRAALYPLSYGGKGDERSAPAARPRIALGPSKPSSSSPAGFRFEGRKGARLG
jgi:hypothetical protein